MRPGERTRLHTVSSVPETGMPAKLEQVATAPHGTQPPPRIRTRGRILVLLVLAAIGWLTLMPQPVNPRLHVPVVCLVCSATGGADDIANVLLFIPLGFALVLAGASWRAAWLNGAAISLLIELSQFLVIPGRFATLSDLLTNTIGALLGASIATHRGRWLRPAPRTAGQLALAATALWLATLEFSSWATERRLDVVSYEPAAGDLPYAPTFGWFEGTVETATVGGQVIPHRGSGPVIVAAPVGARFETSLTAVGVDRRTSFVPLLFVHARGDTTPTFVLGLRGRDAVLATTLRGQSARLRPIWIVIHDALPAIGAAEARYTMRGSACGDSLRLIVRTAATTRVASVALGPAIAWATITGIPALDSTVGPAISVAWIVILALPLGYWARMARARIDALAFAALAVGAPYALAGRWATPRFPLSLLAATVSGLVVGFAIASRQSRRSG